MWECKVKKITIEKKVRKKILKRNRETNGRNWKQKNNNMKTGN